MDAEKLTDCFADMKIRRYNIQLKT